MILICRLYILTDGSRSKHFLPDVDIPVDNSLPESSHADSIAGSVSQVSIFNFDEDSEQEAENVSECFSSSSDSSDQEDEEQILRTNLIKI